MCKFPKESKLKTSSKLLFSENTVLKRPIQKFKIIRSKISTTRSPESNIESTYEQELYAYLCEIHQVFKKINENTPNTPSSLQEKVCERCNMSFDGDLFLSCGVCEDAYHAFCLDPGFLKVSPEDDDLWICPICTQQNEEVERIEEEKQLQSCFAKKSLKELEIQIPSNKMLDVTICRGCMHIINNMEGAIKLECNSETNQRSSKIEAYETCMKCGYYFHPQCFNLKRNSILCYVCYKEIQSNTSVKMPQTEKQINDFFSKDDLVIRFYPNPSESKTEEYQLNDRDCKIIQKLQMQETKRFYNKKIKKFTRRTNKLKFNLPKLSEDSDQILKRKQSLAFALIAKDISFEDDLCFSNPYCPISCNNADLEPGLQKMDDLNTVTFLKFKEMTRRGNYPPVMIQQDRQQGFIVVADEDIPKSTLIAEYGGEVDFLRNRLFGRNDSMMDLLQTPHSWNSLVTCAEKRGNIARFLSGINNSDKDAKRLKQNVRYFKGIMSLVD